jgi:hypothetical protein
MDDCGGENNGRARKDWKDRANQADSEERDRQEPPEEFHLVNRKPRMNTDETPMFDHRK